MSDHGHVIWGRVIDQEARQQWRDILGEEATHIPLESSRPEWAALPGLGRRWVYKLHLPLLTAAQRDRLERHLAARFDAVQADVARELDAVGLPVRAETVAVVIVPERFITTGSVS